MSCHFFVWLYVLVDGLGRFSSNFYHYSMSCLLQTCDYSLSFVRSYLICFLWNEYLSQVEPNQTEPTTTHLFVLCFDLIKIKRKIATIEIVCVCALSLPFDDRPSGGDDDDDDDDDG